MVCSEKQVVQYLKGRRKQAKVPEEKKEARKQDEISRENINESSVKGGEDVRNQT